MINGSVQKPERVTQDRIVSLFQTKLGYTYLGDFQYREGNSNIEEALLSIFLHDQGHSEDKVNKVIYGLSSVANDHGQNLYSNNKAVYTLLRYGVSIPVDGDVRSKTIQVIDWQNPLKNRFYIAEEVTVNGEHEKRPDIVLYVNGIAIGILELKNSRNDISEGIRQSITNQQSRFIKDFFSTIQLIFAGNDSQGLRYGTIKTDEKYFLSWKEDEEDNFDYKIDKYLLKMCSKERLIELMLDFVLFDGGIKKLPRPHQYFGVKATQEKIRQREGGIIWHTQGSGKSITMVYLAKWILENNPHARVLVITDRAELDKQIEGVFRDAGEAMYRTSSGHDLMLQLNQAAPRLLCSLVHKFGSRNSEHKSNEKFEAFIKELESSPCHTVGELFVFVDECHRTQSGRLHKTMKAILTNAIFIGFTGTPLLKKDKATSLEVFGNYIHTYKFNEAVEDGVVLDLIYEARDIDQRLSSQEKVDAWFEAKTRGLNEFQQAEIKKKWGTEQNIRSSASRMSKVVTDIVYDFGVKPRLDLQHGNAMLVASSIYEACRYFELFQKTMLKGKCAVVTSYNPLTKDIATEDIGANTETDKEFIYRLYTEILGDVRAHSGLSKTEIYEDFVKQKFVDEPANMKLIIVVDKLLTGFDAPSCTYLYIDKSMQDHGLFQAICRVNRLDGDDKEYGYVVDYKDLFKQVEDAVHVYTSELAYDSFDKSDCDVLLRDRLVAGKERLDNAFEKLELICEPVKPPKGDLEHIHYFCGNTEQPEDLKVREMLRTSLYKATVSLIRAYSNIADDLSGAGYTEFDINVIRDRLDYFLKLRDIIKHASGETIDLKAYESDMRYLIDHYIQAEDSVVISPFGDTPLIDIIVNSGIDKAIDSLPDGIKSRQEAVAETIENNVRRRIIKDHLLDPAYFDKMSKLLEELIGARKKAAVEYREYLKKIADLAERTLNGKEELTPASLNTAAKRTLWNNLGNDEALAIQIDTAIMVTKSDGWRGNGAKENQIKQAIFKIVNDVDEVERIFNIVRHQQEY